MSVFAALALIVPLLCAGALLLHEHGEAGHHLHALPQSAAVQLESGWPVEHAHQHAAERAGARRDEPRAHELDSVPAGLVLRTAGPWTLVASREGAQRSELALAFRALAPCEARVERVRDLGLRPRAEWPPPLGSSSGVRWLLQTSHALLI